MVAGLPRVVWLAPNQAPCFLARHGIEPGPVRIPGQPSGYAGLTSVASFHPQLPAPTFWCGALLAPAVLVLCCNFAPNPSAIWGGVGGSARPTLPSERFLRDQIRLVAELC